MAVIQASKEAGPVPLVTGGAGLFYLNEQSIAVAIHCDILDHLHVSAGFAFHPEFFSGAAPKPSAPGFYGFFQGRLVHPSHHQDSPTLSVLKYDGDQAIDVPFQTFGNAHRILVKDSNRSGRANWIKGVSARTRKRLPSKCRRMPLHGSTGGASESTKRRS